MQKRNKENNCKNDKKKKEEAVAKKCVELEKFTDV